jgi:hypothetical protein
MEMGVVRKCYWACLFFFSIHTNGFALTEKPALERTITVSFENEKASEALKKISKLAGVTFSYSPSAMNADKIITQTFTNQSLREIIDFMFDGNVRCKAKGNYLILTPVAKKNTATVSGYVVDEATGEKLKDVSVYDPITLRSAITNEFGYFEIKIEKPTAEDMQYILKRNNYADTVLVVKKNKGSLQRIGLKSKARLEKLSDDIGNKLSRLLSRSRQRALHINKRNIRDTLYRTAQISFVPFVGSNHKLSGQVVNGYSLNVLGGFSAGTSRAEFGGLFNINQGDVKFFQAAGLFNTNGGKTQGAQMAGLFNTNLSATSGTQVAGLFNLNNSTTDAAQMAGLFNSNRGVTHGAQMAGLFNVNKSYSRGVQMAGLFNLNEDSAKVVQLAGLINTNRKKLNGVQISGLTNIADDITGAQVSGLINSAKTINGAQIGFINVADSVKGIPFGFLSFVRKGYHKLEISVDEIFPVNVALRTGVNHFHNILSVGVQTNRDTALYSFGYGFGSLLKLSKRWSFNTDISYHQIVKDDFKDLNMINKLFVGLDFRIAKKASITAGATLNLHIFEKEKINGSSVFSYYTPTLLSEGTWGRNGYQWWLGAKVGLRFF